METENSGYFTRLREHAHRFHKAGMRAIVFHKNLMGTVFDVYRLKDQSKAKVAYGAVHLHSAIFSSGGAEVPDYDKSQYDHIGQVKLVFPLSDMHAFYETQSLGSVEVIDDESSLEIGDELVTSYNKSKMFFKVEAKDSYGEQDDTISRYIIGFRRVLTV